MFAVVNGSLALAAWLLTDTFVAQHHVWRRCWTTILTFLMLSVGWALVLGAMGLLTSGWQMGVSGLSMATAGTVWVRRRRGGGSSSATRDVGLPHAHLVLARCVFGLGLCAAFLLILSEPQARSFDDYTYQGTATFEFIVNQSLRLSVLKYQHFYPMNSELFTAWQLLPTRQDGHTALSGVFWLAVCATFLLGLSTNNKRHWMSGWCAAVGFFTMGEVWKEASTHTATDIAVAAMVLALLSALRPSGSRGLGLQQLFFAGSAAGLLVGMKVSHVVVLLPTCIYLWARRSEVRRAGALHAAMAFLVPLIFFGGYWYLRNWIETGNPVYPAAFGPFWGPFDTTSQSRTKLFTWVFGHLAAPGNFTVAFNSYLERDPLIVLSFAGACLQLLECLRARSLSIFRDHQTLLLATALVIWLTFPLMPFSGTSNSPGGEINTQARFTLGALVIGLLLFSSRGQGWAMVVLGAAWSRYYWRAQPFSWTPYFVVLAAWCGSLLIQRFRLEWRPRFLSPVLLLVVFTWAQLIQPSLQAQVDKLIFYGRFQGAEMGAPWRTLEKLPDGQVVAQLGRLPMMRLGAYGRRLQHRVVNMMPDGIVPPPNPHEFWRKHRKKWWRPWYEQQGKFSVTRLQKAGVTVLILRRGKRDGWPKARRILRKSSAATRLATGHHYEVWQISK